MRTEPPRRRRVTGDQRGRHPLPEGRAPGGRHPAWHDEGGRGRVAFQERLWGPPTHGAESVPHAKNETKQNKAGRMRPPNARQRRGGFGRERGGSVQKPGLWTRFSDCLSKQWSQRQGLVNSHTLKLRNSASFKGTIKGVKRQTAEQEGIGQTRSQKRKARAIKNGLGRTRPDKASDFQNGLVTSPGRKPAGTWPP